MSNCALCGALAASGLTTRVPDAFVEGFLLGVGIQRGCERMGVPVAGSVCAGHLRHLRALGELVAEKMGPEYAALVNVGGLHSVSP